MNGPETDEPTSEAPQWFRDGMDAIEERVSKLEQVVLADAAKRAASAGRRWGSFAGAFVVAASTMLAQCEANASTVEGAGGATGTEVGR